MSLSIPVHDLRLIQDACREHVQRLHEQGKSEDTQRMVINCAMLATVFEDGVKRYELRAVKEGR
jgi:hypothetical protein